MAKYSENPNFQKCEPSQKKTAFKEAYQQVRTLIDTPIDSLDPKDKRALDALIAVVGQMSWKKSEVYFDAIKIAGSRHLGTFEDYSLTVRKVFREKSVGGRGEGKLPA